MKKKFYATLLAVAVIAFTGYNVYRSQKADASLFDMAMANVEALANGEQENGIKCIGEGTVDCPIGIKVEAVIRFYGLE